MVNYCLSGSSINLLLFYIFGVLMLTFKTDLDCKFTGTNETQSFIDDKVPDLKMTS